MSFAGAFWSHKNDKNLRFEKSEKNEICDDFNSKNLTKTLK